MYLLAEIRKTDFSIIIAHFDHQLRPESAEEAKKLAELTRGYSLPFTSGKADVHSLAVKDHQTIEEAARKARYQFLFQKASEFSAQAVVTGHTADDQVETILMHLLRGSGLAGLRGMVYRSLPNPWSDRIPLVRPLLNIWRQQIQDYLKDRNIEPFEDSTNFDTRYARNQLRLEILPILEDKYPGFCQRLWQMAILVGDDLEIINSQVDKAWEKCFLARNSFSISFDLASLRNEPPSLQRYILRRAEHSLQPEITDLGFEAIDRGLNFIKKPSRSQQCEWIGGLWLSIQHGVFIISYSDMDDSESILSEWPQLATSQTISLPIPGKIRLAGNWELSASYQSVEERVLENIYINRDPYSAWVTIESKPERLQVRQRQPGDRLKPLGMSGQSIKVSDLMINQKIPSKARKRWPLVISEQDIIWIPGLRLNENYRLADSDRLAIFLQLRKISNEGQENTV